MGAFYILHLQNNYFSSQFTNRSTRAILFSARLRILSRVCVLHARDLKYQAFPRYAFPRDLTLALSESRTKRAKEREEQSEETFVYECKTACNEAKCIFLRGKFITRTTEERS